MMQTDIDIDLKDRNSALCVLPHILASMNNQGKTVRHSTGVYFQDIPVDPSTDLASFPYDRAEDLGYFKIDFINNSAYQDVRDEEHLFHLMNQEPAWELMEDPDVVSMLVHIHSHFDIVSVIKPKSIDDIAAVLALIRPGKRHLLHKSRAEIDANLWTSPTDGSYHFKKAHAYAYAVLIAVQLNAIVEKSLSQ